MNPCVCCKWWSVSTGECHRRPPQVVAEVESHTVGDSGEYRSVISTRIKTVWPKTEPSDGCGEWYKK